MKDAVENPSTDIALLAQEALQAATSPERVKEIIDKQISETVASAIRDATRSYSSFARDLEKKIEAALAINNLDLPSYNNLVCAMVQNQVEALTTELINGRLKSDVAEILKVAPKTVKLSELVEEMRKPHEEDGGYGEVVTCIVERMDHSDSDFWGPKWKIYLDDHSHYHWKDRGNCDVVLEIHHGIKENRELANHEINSGTIVHIQEWSGTLTSKGGQVGFSMKRPYGLSQRMLAMYAAETVIEVDEDEICVSVGDY